MARVILTMSDIHIVPVSTLRATVQKILGTAIQRLERILPNAKIHHIGSTAIPGMLTKGDLDLLIQVPQAHFQSVTQTLKQHFAVNQPENWTTDYASFKEDEVYPLPLGVQLVIENSSMDFFLNDYFRKNHEAVKRYNALKRTYAGGVQAAYLQAKADFLETILKPWEERRIG